MLNLAAIKDILEALSYLSVFVGLPLALLQYRRKTLKEQADREYGTYNALDEKYLEFLRLCYGAPELDIFDVPDSEPIPLTPIQQKLELIAFTMLISIFERAYLMYHGQTSAIRVQQWKGWSEYIRDYCKRSNFRNTWDLLGGQFDTGFEHFMKRLLNQTAGERGDQTPRRDHDDAAP